jgi:hypothetical protein
MPERSEAIATRALIYVLESDDLNN